MRVWTEAAATRMCRVGLMGLAAVFCVAGAQAQWIGAEKAWFTPLSEAPAIDGAQDAVWDEVDWMRMSDIIIHLGPASAEDLSARFKLGYEGDAMYLFVEVTDDVAYGELSDASWQRDSLEIYLDLAGAAGPIGDHNDQAAAWRDNGGPAQMRFMYNEAARGFGAEDGGMTDDDAVFATTRDDEAGITTYEVQLNPPSALDLASIESFGFILQVNDADDADNLEKPPIGWWGGPEQPAGEHNPEITGLEFRPFQDSSVWAEGGFAEAPELSVQITGPGLLSVGSDGVLHALVTHAVGEVSYQWFKDGVALDGAVDSDYMIVDAGEGDSGLYTVVVVDEEEQEATSPDHNLTVGTDLPVAGAWALYLLTVLLAGAAALALRRARA